MRRNAIVMIGLGVIAALISLFFILDRDAPRGGPRDPSGVLPEIEAPGLESAAPSRVAESRPVAAIRPRRAPEASETDAMSPDEVLRVLVVDESTGAPVPGAEVAWTDETITRPRRVLFYSSASPLMSDFDRARQKTVADARGVAVVRTSGRLAIAARSGERFGLRAFKDAPRGEVRLPIAPGLLVAARVLNEAGVPLAGVGVVISIHLRRGGGSSDRAFHALSRDPDGLAIVHHSGVASEGPFGDRKDITEITASIDGAGPEGRIKATVDDLAAGPVTLTLRQVGRVVVKLADADGRPFLSETRVSLQAAASSGRSMPATFEATTTSGSAEFPLVAAGSVLTASAESAGFDTVTREKLAGPKSSGDDTTIELRFVRQRAVVRGKVVDETGSPLSRRELRAELVLSEASLLLPGPMRLATDARGEFSFTIDGGNPRLTEVDLLLEMLDGGDALGGHVRTPLPRLAANGETWLGEVTISRPRTLASGVVRDELGAPIAGALVTVDEMQSSFPPGFVLSIGSRTLPSGAQVYRARTDESGAFEMPLYGLGSAKISGFSLEGALDGYVCPDPPAGLKPGAKDVIIVLSATGVVEGRILLPDLAPIRRLSLSVPVTDPSTGGTTKHRFEDCVDSSGAFRLTGVRPGVGKLEVRLSGVDEPLASIPDVAVRRLETTDDARLRPIDLRGHPALRLR